MFVKHGSVFFLFVYIFSQATARSTVDISHIFQHLKSTSNRNPLVVIVDLHNQKGNIEDSDESDPYVTKEVDTEEDTAKEAKNLLYNYLLKDVDLQNTSEDEEDSVGYMIGQALRARCQARVKCEKKCDKGRDKKKYCPVNCKAVFDQLDLCGPPEEEEEEEEKKCGDEEKKCNKRGRTMPPKWL